MKSISPPEIFDKKAFFHFLIRKMACFLDKIPGNSIDHTDQSYNDQAANELNMTEHPSVARPLIPPEQPQLSLTVPYTSSHSIALDGRHYGFADTVDHSSAITEGKSF